MTKKELIEAMAKKADMTPDAADKALKALTTVITEALQQDDVITIPGLGVYRIQQRAARENFVPSKGEKIVIPAKTMPVFRASKTLKDKISA